ncbi:Tyrosine--tRNA ligase 1, cytoplasmic [Gracilariopsis chorda]|uniref:tyrosine--tRNA ligase n=1 Tax=Gracilariopsis chorda TaxID=448386 RepID=A0A2V3J1M2_9FLOR|nr:Tyrosine--tRNA ligase 1, cytoplasmic [Gracilariopsis chorda]|eukprot:PXF48288.1 Tyrosine--tRNA ligase 1, cytoplasmic [Gracilariopsis chorda]
MAEETKAVAVNGDGEENEAQVGAVQQAVSEMKLVNGMSVDERVQLIMSVGEECHTEEGLRLLLEKKPSAPVCYDGFEPSGRMHIAQGIQKSINVNKLTKAGCTFVFWVADWFAQLNNKMGGDMKKIRVVGEYFIEVWKACGMNMEQVKFLWASDEINKRPNEYWTRVMNIATLNSVSRIKRCCTIMGREDGDELSAAQIMYPCMQCADIFFLKADICQLGMDQRKVNMLAREYCEQAKPKMRNKPIIVSHHMMPGLKQGQAKMSKSDPSSAIYMEDSVQEVNSKIKAAFCPERSVEGNPVLEYVKYLVLPKLGALRVKRSAANGGDVSFDRYEDVAQHFASGALHPGDLKPAVARAINEMLQPVREHFRSDAHARKLLEQVRRYKSSRRL